MVQHCTLQAYLLFYWPLTPKLIKYYLPICAIFIPTSINQKINTHHFSHIYLATSIIIISQSVMYFHYCNTSQSTYLRVLLSTRSLPVIPRWISEARFTSRLQRQLTLLYTICHDDLKKKDNKTLASSVNLHHLYKNIRGNTHKPTSLNQIDPYLLTSTW